MFPELVETSELAIVYVVVDQPSELAEFDMLTDDVN